MKKILVSIFFIVLLVGVVKYFNFTIEHDAKMIEAYKNYTWADFKK